MRVLMWTAFAQIAAAATSLLLVASAHAEPSKSAPQSEAAAEDFANFFGEVGEQLYEQECIFELSDEQLDVQEALVGAYLKHGASASLARQLAADQITPPPLSERCQEIKNAAKPIPSIEAAKPKAPKKPDAVAGLPWAKQGPADKTAPAKVAPSVSTPLASKAVLPQWDCEPGVDFVTVQHKGYGRKLSGGEICKPFEDVVRPVPTALTGFRFGYTITTGRLFVISDDATASGKTIAWAISGREICRNNPDPDCLAARAVGPLPPGEYSFASSKEHRVNFGPTSKRMVAGIFLQKLWNRERYSPAQTAAILKRGNIAIHVRLKGEMSEACLGLEPNGWAYVSSLVKEGRVTGVNVYVDEPYPQIAEAAPIVKASSFSLTSLFN